MNLGGAASKIFDFSLIGDHLTTDRSLVSQDSMFRFVDHVDDVGILAYSSPQFVRTNIPLKELFKFLPVSHARKIASIHCIPSGSRCSIAELLMHVENHSCLQCSSHSTVFSIEKNNDQLNRKRVTKFRERKLKLQENEISASVASEFPPFPATTDLTDLILSKACKKMHPKAIEEAGCAVCGELKPLQKMSRLKSVKNFLGILEAPGVTRIERRRNTQIVKEYTGPVLDYACSHICEPCRRDVRKGKVPRLALANNLWLGKVPDELKNLRFVEKILIARVRHTCAYVKVASGMRKMKANVVAFESPIPKIYSVLPPPREDLDEVLAILFTGPSKPTSEDFSRTPFQLERFSETEVHRICSRPGTLHIRWSNHVTHHKMGATIPTRISLTVTTAPRMTTTTTFPMFPRRLPNLSSARVAEVRAWALARLVLGGARSKVKAGLVEVY